MKLTRNEYDTIAVALGAGHEELLAKLEHEHESSAYCSGAAVWAYGNAGVLLRQVEDKVWLVELATGKRWWFDEHQIVVMPDYLQTELSA